MALAASSVAALTGSHVDIALGASSPAIVSGWHDRDWAHRAARMEETIGALRPILAGHRSDHDGHHVRTHGFRLRRPLPDARISVAAFGPAMTRVAAAPRRRGRRQPRAAAARSEPCGRRSTPRRRRWVARRRRWPSGWRARSTRAAKLERSSRAQLAVYLAPPGYGEMFSELGFADLVERARGGMPRSELAHSIPDELLEQVCALGSPEELVDEDLGVLRRRRRHRGSGALHRRGSRRSLRAEGHLPGVHQSARNVRACLSRERRGDDGSPRNSRKAGWSSRRATPSVRCCSRRSTTPCARTSMSDGW